MNNIKVSVIIPIYNSEMFLKRCLDSIIGQTLKEIEIICVNDGSTDKSEEIVKSYNDERIKLISQENAGLSAARNAGMEIATGEFTGFIDSDDWLELNFYEKLYEAAKRNNADIAVGSIIRLHKFHRKNHLKIQKETLTTDINEKFKLCDVPNKCYVWNKIYKTSKLNENNLRFINGRIYEDVVFTPETLYTLGSLVTVPDTHYYYWRHPNSLVKAKSQKAIEDSRYMHNLMEEFIKKHNIDVSENKTVTKRHKFLGFTIYKIKTTGKNTEYNLFNIIKWHKKGS